MKAAILTLFYIGLTYSCFSQVTGKLTTGTGEPLAMANVLLLRGTDTIPVKIVLTDDKGIFTIVHAQQGRYFLRCSSVGYQTWESPLFELTDTGARDLGTQVLKAEAKQLAEAVVRHVRPLVQQQAGGIVVNVENSVLSKGSSALEVLERSPGVLIDHRDNSIDLNGKSGVMVMINGKLMRIPMPQVIALLNSVSADDVEKIELLTTPPAQYDAEGNGGLINIVLKKNKKKGTNGSFSLTGGYGMWEKAMASVNLAHNTENVDVYASYTYSHNRTYNTFNVTSTQDFPSLGGDMDVLFRNSTKPVENDHNASLAVDARLSPHTTIGGSVAFTGSGLSTSVVNRASYTIVPDSLLLFNGQIDGSNRWTNLISSVYLDKEMRKGEKISYAADYLYYHNDNPTQLHSSFISHENNQPVTSDSLYAPEQRGFASTTIRVGVGRVDYSRQLSKKTKFETGVKGTYTTSTSLSGIESLKNGAWSIQDGTTNNIVMKEGIGAVYGTMTSQIGRSTSLVIGARYEYSRTRMNDVNTGKDTIDRKLSKLFPNLSLTRQLGGDMQLQLSYSRRISRPTYNDLTSFIVYNDPISVFTGNPLIQPTIANILKLGANYRDYSFSVLFSQDDHPIIQGQLTKSPSGDLLYISPQNLTYQRSLVLQANLPVKVKGWWTMNYNLTGGWKNFSEVYTVQPVEKTYFFYSANFSETFKLPRKYSVELSGWYNSTSYYGTVRVGGAGEVNGGIKKEFKNDKGTLQLSVSDIFRTMKFTNFFGAITEEAFDVKSHVMINTESSHAQIVKLTYTRSFGASGAKSRRSPDSGSQDEIQRIRQ
jgi:iron complex outermembrane recepter protein